YHLSLIQLPAVAISCQLGHPEADLAATRTSQFLPIESELLLRPVPAPGAAVYKVHDKQILQLFNFREAEAFRFGDGTFKWNLLLDIAMPALQEPATQAGIGYLEVHDQVDSARSFESPVDQVELAVGGEHIDDSLGDGDAVKSCEKDRLIVRLGPRLTI